MRAASDDVFSGKEITHPPQTPTIMNRRPSTSHYKAVYIPVQQAPKEVNLPPVQRFGPAEHLKALEKLFAKDRTEQGRAAKNINANGSAHPPSTEAGVVRRRRLSGMPLLRREARPRSDGNVGRTYTSD